MVGGLLVGSLVGFVAGGLATWKLIGGWLAVSKQLVSSGLAVGWLLVGSWLFRSWLLGGWLAVG